MQHKIKTLLEEYRFLDAFREASKDVLTDEMSQHFFLQILRVRNNVALLQEDFKDIHKQADKGNPYMQLAYARLHESLMPEMDSTNTYIQYFQKALDGGVAEARAYLAIARRDGDFGEADLAMYHSELNQAMMDGSAKAVQQVLSDLIYGNYGVDANPRNAVEEIERFLKESESADLYIDPAYYYLEGVADEKLGRTGAALDEYEKAFTSGYMPALYNLAFLSCTDTDGNLADREHFEEILNRGRGYNCTDSLLVYPLLVDETMFDAWSKKDQKTVKQQIADDLTMAISLGEGLAAYFLGLYHEEGILGFAHDCNMAFGIYSHGALLRNTQCYKAMIRMILDDHTAPKEYDEKFAYGAAYLCLMLGGDTLDTVIRGYRKGLLTEHAFAIESVYLPRYEQGKGDDCIDDDEREIGEDDWTMDPDIN